MIRLGLIAVVIILGWVIMWCIRKYIVEPNQHKNHMKKIMTENRELDNQLFEIRRNEGNVFKSNERNR